MKDNTAKINAKLVLEDIENNNTIRVQKQKEKEPLKRYTFYFTQQMKDEIDEKAEASNMGISEFLREIIGKVLEHLEIEE
jgi:regulator of PEP synthase PpsR (kinase-PPPase family)